MKCLAVWCLGLRHFFEKFAKSAGGDLKKAFVKTFAKFTGNHLQ